MLEYLHVKNLVLIDEAEVSFQEGFNVLTGETGAGKSLIIGSVNLAIGQKIPKGVVRQGAEFALVELAFYDADPFIKQLLADYGISADEDEILLTRRILSTGRSICRINGETVSAQALKEIASYLIAVHGQREHAALLKKANHRKILDAYANDAIEETLARLKHSYQNWTDKKAKLKEASMDQASLIREQHLLEYEVKEILSACLSPGEDEALEEEYRKLSNGARIMEALSAAQAGCAAAPHNASDQISRALKELFSAAEYDRQVDTFAGQLSEIENLLNDFNRELSGYLAGFEYSEERFGEVGNRLDQINRLKEKYGATIPLILAAAEKKQARIAVLNDYDSYILSLREDAAEEEKRLFALCEEAGKIRRQYAAVLEKEITKALSELNFPDVRFTAGFSTADPPRAYGTDEIGFLISTNPGEPLKPLEEVASGGELSRIMLALNTVLAKADAVDTLIFDEIDAGISGRTAQKVAEKLKQTAGVHQVICITHLPQIAAMADAHFLIEKQAKDEQTVSEIRSLNEEEQVAELARMLGGVRITDTVFENAREMKEMAKKEYL